MKIEKRIRNAYKKLPVPEAERVLPRIAAEAETQKPLRPGAKRWLRPALAAAVLVCVIAAGVIGVLSVTRANRIEESQAGEQSLSYNDGVIGGRPSNGSVSRSADYADGYYAEMEKGMGYLHKTPDSGWVKGEVVYEDASVEASPREESPCEPIDGDSIEYENAIRAGTLTARELRDVNNIKEWREIVNGQEFSSYAKGRGIGSGNVVEVRTGRYNSKVELRTAQGETLYTARTDVFGKAYLVIPQKYIQSELYAVCGLANVKLESTTGPVVIELSGGEKPKQLDLMLMIDTTGSMGDELEYLKAELEDMVTRVAQQGNYMDIRISVNFYRDEGDEYVVKYFDFRGDVSECVRQLRAQYANGGGDYPEAVHTALDNAVNGHEWRDEAVKLCFFVLDAPPHTESEVQGITEKLNSGIRTASEKGIRLIPVASSGIDKETEFILRSFAVMTGGTYIYLTDHSGIGGGHVEATTSEPGEVEPLNDCMVRVICEFCGLEVPEPASRPENVKITDPDDSVKIYELYQNRMDKPFEAAGEDVAALHGALGALEYGDNNVCRCAPTYQLVFPNGDVYELKYHSAASEDGRTIGVCISKEGVYMQAEATEKARELIETVINSAIGGSVPAPASVPEDFEFSLVWNIYGTSSYDSETGKLVKSSAEQDIENYTASLVLTDEQRAEAYAIISRLDLDAYPREYDPINDPDEETKIMASPCYTIRLSVTAGGKTKTVDCPELAFVEPEKAYCDAAYDLLAAVRDLQALIVSTPEWQAFPEYTVFFE
ncbi:MAG: VWA domain-containing protein [Clostridia bacterium]|nr:VWA domain-containing protein [Clostridia bacterium]